MINFRIFSGIRENILTTKIYRYTVNTPLDGKV